MSERNDTANDAPGTGAADQAALDAEEQRLFDEFATSGDGAALDAATDQNDDTLTGAIGDTAAVDDATTQEQAPVTVQSPSVATADPLASLPPELREMFEAQRKRADEAEQSLRSEAGRVAAFQRQADEAKRQRDEALSRARPAPAAVEEIDFEAEEFRQLQEDYPEVAKPLLKAMAAMNAKNKAIEALLNPTAQAVTTVAQRQDALIRHQQDQATFERNGALLEKDVPGYAAMTTTPEWANWVARQPKPIKDIIDQNGEGIHDPAAAASVLRLYQAETGITPSRTSAPSPTDRRFTANVATPRTAQSGTAVAGPPNDEDALFDYYAQQQAKRK